jgi:hypothetical protein
MRSAGRIKCGLVERWLLVAAALFVQAAQADEVSLRLSEMDIALTKSTQQRVANLARQALERCGPNTTVHPGNFGLAAYGVENRWKEIAEGSRLRIRFSEPFVSESHLGGTLGVSEALIGLEHRDFFVGPDFTRHGTAIAEHLQCGYLPLLELACLAELQPHLSARYRETCAKLERDDKGRIVMPPPDIAPSCS